MAKNVIGIDCAFTGSVVEIPYQEGGTAVLGSSVIFRDEDGKEEFGVIKFVNTPSTDPDKIIQNSKILRPATLNDLQKMESHMDQSGHSLEVCRDLVQKHALEMQVFRSGVSFNGTKVHFMFTADERVDFREMVKDLAKTIKKQIYLRQVGPRDKAKIVGGFGKCGRTLCCSTFLGKLESVSMDMVRDQGLESKGSSKLSGTCGKLLCCLRYEVETYRSLREKLPEPGSVIKLKKSVVAIGREAQVLGLDVLNGKMKVLTIESEFLIINSGDVDKVIKAPARRAQKAEPVPEEKNDVV